MPTVLTLLGRPRVAHEAALYDVPAERRCQLLLALAVRRGWVARSELAALLWPEHRSELAAANLRKALHLARDLPWAGALEITAGALRFCVATDVHDVERAAREGRVVDALALCRGELLDGMDDASGAAWSEWLGAERAQHDRRVRQLQRSRLTQLEADPAQALELARRLLDADPLDEDAVVALLAAQRQLGLTQAQRESYRDFSVRLDEDLGVGPSLRVRAQLHEAAAPSSEQGLFGRAREQGEIDALLARADCRLLTLTGPGGVGKSVLLKHALRRLELQFADGALWIALDDLRDVVQATARIAAELGLAPDPRQQHTLPSICAHLATRQVLLALDNAEHLPALAGLVLRLLEGAAGLKICITSRIRLAVAGEWVLPLGGLALAPAQAAAHETLGCDAARLFVAAAAAVRPGFDAGTQAAAIGALVRSVGGLPLAILLAADWVRLLPAAEIVRELESSLDLLDSGADEGEERPEHRSMRATFELSWKTLAAREQQVLAELSVFVGGFTRRAAGEVTGAPLVLLAALADKSLLQMPAHGRCSLHPLIRRFAIDKLGTERLQSAQRRHAHWYLSELARVGRDAVKGDLRMLDEIDADLENCRHAWRWAVAHGECDLIAAGAVTLMRYFELRGRTLEGLELLIDAHAATCSAADPPPACAAALCASIAHLQIRMYRLDEAASFARRGIAFARAAPARAPLALCLNVLGLCHNSHGRYPQARRFLEQAMRQARAAADMRTATAAQSNLAIVLIALGEYDSARRSMLELLAQQREWGDWVRVASLLNNLAALHTMRGDWEQARERVDEGIEVAQAHGISQAQPQLFVNRAELSLQLRGDDEAELAIAQALEVAREFGNRGAEGKALLLLAQLATRRRAFAAARGHLQQSLACPPVAQNPPLQVEWLFAVAYLRAAQGETGAAATLLGTLLARADIEPVARSRAQDWLAARPDDPADPPEPNAALPDLLRRCAAELAFPMPCAPGTERGGTSGD